MNKQDQQAIKLSFGALCKPLKEQVRARGYELQDDSDLLQRMADSISFLLIHQIATDAEAHRMRKRLVKAIQESIR